MSHYIFLKQINNFSCVKIYDVSPAQFNFRIVQMRKTQRIMHIHLTWNCKIVVTRRKWASRVQIVSILMASYIVPYREQNVYFDRRLRSCSFVHFLAKDVTLIPLVNNVTICWKLETTIIITNSLLLLRDIKGNARKIFLLNSTQKERFC